MEDKNPNVHVTLTSNDPLLLKAKKLLDETRAAILALINHIFTGKGLKKEFLPFLVILFRMGQTVSSLELLLYAKLERDAATLMLTLMELRYDALYMAADLRRTQEWLDHDKENKKPWGVTYLIQQLYKNKNECDAELGLYRKCSMKKHGNPFGGAETFPLGVENGWIVFLPSKFDPKMVATYLLWGCAECETVARTAIETFDTEGIDVKEFKQQFEGINRLRSIMTEVNIKEHLVELLKCQANNATEADNSANNE